MSKQTIDLIPEEFDSYEEAAEFWDTHDTADYPDEFVTVHMNTELRQRHYELDCDENQKTLNTKNV